MGLHLRPIPWNLFEAPHVSGPIHQREADEPELFELSERDAVDDAGRNRCARRQAFEMNDGSGLNRPR